MKRITLALLLIAACIVTAAPVSADPISQDNAGYLWLFTRSMGNQANIADNVPDIFITPSENASVFDGFTAPEEYLNTTTPITGAFILPDGTTPTVTLAPGDYTVYLPSGNAAQPEKATVSIVAGQISYVTFTGEAAVHSSGSC
jgi:hypothetical protein